MGLTASQAAKLQEAQEILAHLQSIMDLVNEEFPPATPPQAQVVEVSILRTFEKARISEAKKTTSFFARSERRKAIQAARELARSDREAALAPAANQARLDQVELNDLWRRLCANDPDVVVETLNEAFADNEAPAACVGVHEARATIVVVAPDPDDVIPERMPSVTDAGNVSLRKMSKSDRNKYYSAVLYGHALVSSKEAFAVAPGLDSLAVIVVSRPGIDVYGERRRPNALVAATVRRAALNGVRWSEHGGDEILPQVADELVVNRKGRAATSIRSSSITSRRSPQLSTWSMPRSRSGTHRSFGAPVGVPERVDCSRHPGAHPVGGLSFAPVSGSSDDSDTMRFQQRAER